MKDTQFEQRSRGGIRRGRANDPEIVCDLHVRVMRETRRDLQGIAGASKCTVGELIDQMVKSEMRKQSTKAA